jgi:glucosamine-6-phosphate deaminase
MNLHLLPDPPAIGNAAADRVAAQLTHAIAHRGEAILVLATGMSQLATLAALRTRPVDWSAVTVFHLDEYIGLPASHKASFRHYIKERFSDHLPLRAAHLIQGDNPDPQAECQRLADLFAGRGSDATLAGIGDTGHLAFNDPPANFHAPTPYLVVPLLDGSRLQQVRQGWFDNLGQVPTQAITMSISQIMESALIVCLCQGAAKAEVVRRAVEGPITPDFPASILQSHPNCQLLLDPPAASALAKPPVG